MNEELTRFDMKRPPIPTRWYLQPLEWILSFPAVIRHRNILRRSRTEGL